MIEPEVDDLQEDDLMPQEKSKVKGRKHSKKKGKVRRGSLSHQKAIVCKGKLGPHAWDSKRKKYEKEPT
jgi:hypothetical protein